LILFVRPDSHPGLVSAKFLVYFMFNNGTTRLIHPGEALDIVTENSIGEGGGANPAPSAKGRYLSREIITSFLHCKMISGVRIAVNNVDKRHN
jgi:hypothetical protein